MPRLKKYILVICVLFIARQGIGQSPALYHLRSDSLARRWDEGVPLGNGWLGVLIWQKNDKLRMSLDRVDLWDDRPMPEIDQLTFSWVREKVKRKQYDSVQKLGDEPYEKYPAPTKIPGAAIEFDLSRIGKVVSSDLDITNGLSVIRFDNGIVFNNYVHATEQIGFFGFENTGKEMPLPELMIPAYAPQENAFAGNSVEGQSLSRLGYAKGTVKRTARSILYHQPTWGQHYYEVLVKWQTKGPHHLIGQWTIAVDKPAQLADLVMTAKEPTRWPTHIAWWKDFWKRSYVNLPDKQIERQYYLDLYKFACVARSNTPPISLQAIWTADDGKLPPWKGDFHHDLNTQLSYWPGYASNHLDLTAGYTNWLLKVKKENERWTKEYFKLGALNVPGVTTITGRPMGGWVQYSLSPSTASWLAQHFYWQAMYSMDPVWAAKAASYSRDAYLFANAYIGEAYKDQSIIMSSSPEYHDNSLQAWFQQWTNYDKALFVSLKEQHRKARAIIEHRVSRLFDTPDQVDRMGAFDQNETGLTIARGQNLDESHRHHAHLMAIHPLGLLNPADSAQHDLIERSLRHLEKVGTRLWCGYSFSWAACIYARAKEPEQAVRNLQIFASNFVSSNSFHLNGDQKGGQYSNFTYRPFTLEGNFAFAQGVHELLLQSHRGYIEVFPAVPKEWKEVSFSTLRTEGAFLVSSAKVGGVVDYISIQATVDNELNLLLPFKTWYCKEIPRSAFRQKANGILSVRLKKGEKITIRNGYE